MMKLQLSAILNITEGNKGEGWVHWGHSSKFSGDVINSSIPRRHYHKSD